MALRCFDICGGPDLSEIDRHAVNDDAAGLDETVVAIHVTQIRHVKPTGHPRRVSVPEQQVERCRFLPQKVALDGDDQTRSLARSMLNVSAVTLASR